MVQPTIGTFATSSSPSGATKVWNLASVVVISVAIFISLNILTLRGFGATVWGLLSAATVLCLFGLVHIRFLSVAQGQSRETCELLLTKSRQLQFIFDNSLNAILVFDSNGICENASPSCSRLLGSQHNRTVGQSIRGFYANPQEFDSFWEHLLSDNGFQGEAEFVRPDGMTVFAEFTVARHFLPHRHLMILHDITQRRRAQHALSRSLVLARASSQEADALGRATLALTEDLRMDRVLGTLLETLRRFVPCEHAQVFLLEDDGRLFLAHETASDPGAASELGLPETLELSEFPLLSAVLERQDGIIFDDVSEGEMWKRSSKSSRVRSWMGIPIYSSNQALGLLLLSHSSPAVFARGHLRLGRSLANSAAVAIQNARLYERAEIYAVELEGRIPEVRRVQSMKRSVRERGSEISESGFKKVFRSAPVAMSVTSLPAGRFIEMNEAFARRFGLKGKNVGGGTIEEFRLWEDPGEWKGLLERLKCGTKVRREGARLRTKSGNYDYVRFSAEAIDLEGQACLLLVTEDPPDLTAPNAQD